MVSIEKQWYTPFRKRLPFWVNRKATQKEIDEAFDQIKAEYEDSADIERRFANYYNIIMHGECNHDNAVEYLSNQKGRPVPKNTIPAVSEIMIPIFGERVCVWLNNEYTFDDVKAAIDDLENIHFEDYEDFSDNFENYRDLIASGEASEIEACKILGVKYVPPTKATEKKPQPTAPPKKSAPIKTETKDVVTLTTKKKWRLMI